MCDDVLFVGFALLLPIARIWIPNFGLLVHQEGFVEVLFLAHGPCGQFVLVFFAYYLQIGEAQLVHGLKPSKKPSLFYGLKPYFMVLKHRRLNP
jgi:hypothetical protein